MLVLEKDTILVDGPRMPYPNRKNDYSYGFKYNFNNNFTLGLSHERGSYFSFKFTYKNDPKSTKKNYEYKKAKINANDSNYTKLIKNLEENGIGVNKIIETSRSLD